MAVKYDENVIAEFASRLYTRAAIIVLFCTLLGAGLGVLIVMGVKQYLPGHIDALHSSPVRSSQLGDEAWIGIIGGAILGYMVGEARAFGLRLIAQTSLCQVEIERHTRAVAKATAATPNGSRSREGAESQARESAAEPAVEGSCRAE